METATQYAKALWRIEDKNIKVLRNLREVLKHRGHEKLLPKIFAEYQKLEIAQKRSEMHRRMTPAMQRTKILLDLYNKLVS